MKQRLPESIAVLSQASELAADLCQQTDALLDEGQLDGVQLDGLLLEAGQLDGVLLEAGQLDGVLLVVLRSVPGLPGRAQKLVELGLGLGQRAHVHHVHLKVGRKTYLVKCTQCLFHVYENACKYRLYYYTLVTRTNNRQYNKHVQFKKQHK